VTCINAESLRAARGYRMRHVLPLVICVTLAACATDPGTPAANNDSLIPGPPLPASRIFPPGDPWNTDISGDSVDPDSDSLIARCGANAELHPDFGTWYQGVLFGIPYATVDSTQPRVPVSFYYDDESDPGPYPIPPNAPIEGGGGSHGDRHVIVIDVDEWKLYELFDARPVNGGASWTAGSGAIFDLTTNTVRPEGWTSADAAGLPIFPGLVRYDEAVTAGAIDHALRFTCPVTRRAYLPPARHQAGSTNSAFAPPMGMRVRLKASVDISGFPAEVQVILTALKTYGMILADNGSPFYLSGAPHPGWNDDNINLLKQIRGRDFEVVLLTGVLLDP
jgi:hypothetical protein